MAGHSRRFAEKGYNIPKFLIKIDGKYMIEHIVEMFDKNDFFHFIINSNHLNQFPDIGQLLNKITNNNELIVIKPNEKGPVYSIIKSLNIPDRSKFIISYCDFKVYWNYKKFKREVVGMEGAIPSFRGMHPASFGDTYYAYIQVNKKNEMLELKEKESFTDNRQNEFASTGIYYFKNWKRFKQYAKMILEDSQQVLPEAYVSLIYNPMVKDGYKIKVTEVKYFICWGTPRDVDHYNFWSIFFKTNYRIPLKPLSKNKQINIMPMAGKGERFKNYDLVKKPFIKIGNQTMMEKSIDSMPGADKWFFVVKKIDIQKNNASFILNKIRNNSHIIELNGNTKGQAITCSHAIKKAKKDDSIFIASCDYVTIFDNQKWQKIIDDQSIDGAIWTFKLNNTLVRDYNNFGYCVTNSKNKIVKSVIEKKIISKNPYLDPMIVGSFWFRKASDYSYMMTEMINKDITINNEYYIANGINILIKNKRKFVIFDIEQWISFGDPFELEVFNYWRNVFNTF